MHAKTRYPLSSYDQYLCLKPPLLLWAATLYLSRAILLSFLAQFTNSTSGGGYDAVAAMRGAFGVDALIPSALASLVLVALLIRSPARGRLARWVSRRGRWMLVCSALVYFALTVSDAVGGLKGLGDLPFSAVLTSVFDLYVLVYLLASRRVRDVFATYPAAEEAGEK